MPEAGAVWEKVLWWTWTAVSWRTKERSAAWLRERVAESQEVLPETSSLVRPMQRERPACPGNRCRSYQAASRQPEFVLGRKELAAPLQELPWPQNDDGRPGNKIPILAKKRGSTHRASLGPSPKTPATFFKVIIANKFPQSKKIIIMILWGMLLVIPYFALSLNQEFDSK